jgi:hypothetical protein
LFDFRGDAAEAPAPARRASARDALLGAGAGVGPEIWARLAPVSSSIDLGSYVQRRLFRAYERDMARSSYAYGVDARRIRWLTTSALGQAGLRSIEHAWFQLADELLVSELRYPEQAEEIPLLNEVIALCHLLHATPPAIRLLTASSELRDWGLVTPLGDPRSSDDWLVLNAEGLAAAPAEARSFMLGSGMAHLQCGHGVLFIAHLVGHRRGRLGLYRRLLAPWSRVAAFSADRAGLLAVGALGPALAALAAEVAAAPAWSPAFPSLEARQRALTEFAESAVFARISARRAMDSDAGAEAPLSAVLMAAPAAAAEGATEGAAPTAPVSDEALGVPDSAWPLARCDQRLTQRLRIY